MGKTALIVGVSSQDGSYLADLLLEKGYAVVGTIRHTTSYVKENIAHLVGKITIEAADLLDAESLVHLVKKYKPDEVYNIAAQSIPADSWTHPYYTGEVTGLGVVRVLDAVRHHAPEARVYQATSREIYGHFYADGVFVAHMINLESGLRTRAFAMIGYNLLIYWPERAVRFHHRLVSIHPFPNGNGRHARLAADILLIRYRRPRFTWGSKNLIADGIVRREYITALREADACDIARLAAFVRS